MKKNILKEAIRLLRGISVYEVEHEGHKTHCLTFNGKDKKFFIEDRDALLVILKKELNR